MARALPSFLHEIGVKLQYLQGACFESASAARKQDCIFVLLSHALRVRTTLDLPDLLFEKATSRAVEQGIALKDLLTGFIEAGLQSSSKVTVPIGKRHPLPVGIPFEPGLPLHPAMTNAELHDILDSEDREHYLRMADSGNLFE